ncbi:MAG: hypothetical protein ACR2QM_03515 [Longimicrobiales bacterium]
MMAMEGPFLAATIARLPDPKLNLAAHGVAFAIAILIEAPVIMIMSASTALARDRDSYRRLRAFSYGLNLLATLLLLILLIPSVFDVLARGVLGLPPDVADITQGALWFFLPWPIAIGYRRFLHGVMIRSGKTRLVAAGTVLRLATTVIVALMLYSAFDIPGAWVGAGALSAGVCMEAIAARFMAADSVRRTLAIEGPAVGHPHHLDFSKIAHFYYPLALTSLIGLTAHPMLTFFMGRGVAPLESLAVFPVVHALSFVFRALGLSYQEASIALIGDELEGYRPVARFAGYLALFSSIGIALFAFTPLFGFWFSTLSGLTAELVEYARIPAMLLVPLPALSVWLSVQRAVLVQGRRTKAITVATAIELAGIATIFGWVGWGLDWVGVSAAVLAFAGGRAMANLYLIRPCRAVLNRREAL